MEERGLPEVHQEEGTGQGKNLIGSGQVGVGVGRDMGGQRTLNWREWYIIQMMSVRYVVV